MVRIYGPMTEATKRKISDKLKGHPNWTPGYRHTDETKRKMSESRCGISRGPHSDETKRKISESHKGKTWSDEQRKRVRGRILSDETRIKMRLAKLGKTYEEIYGSEIGQLLRQKRSQETTGRVDSEETRQKKSDWQLGKPSPNKRHARRPIEEYEYGTGFYWQEWRLAVLVRDDYRCWLCGHRSERNHAHHIISWEEGLDVRYDPLPELSSQRDSTTLDIRVHGRTSYPSRKDRSDS